VEVRGFAVRFSNTEIRTGRLRVLTLSGVSERRGDACVEGQELRVWATYGLQISTAGVKLKRRGRVVVVESITQRERLLLALPPIKHRQCPIWSVSVRREVPLTQLLFSLACAVRRRGMACV
jgi:hypothetical protein